jgi:hypothetical protein
MPADAFVGTAKIDPLVQPGRVDELEQVVAAPVRQRVPVTGNYGRSVPPDGDVLIDMRRLDRILSIEDDAIAVEAGCIGAFQSDPREIDDVIAHCAQIGVHVANPHSYVVREGGMVKDLARIVAFKQRTDAYGLLNPDKLDGRFYVRASTSSESRL